MLMQAADSKGRNVVASARWVERQTGVHHSAVGEFVTWLVRSGWLSYVGASDRGVPICELRLRTITPRSEDDLEDDRLRSDLPQSEELSEISTAEETAEETAEDYSTTTDHRVLQSTKGRTTSLGRDEAGEDGDRRFVSEATGEPTESPF
jgi:hypothetical protein